MNTTNKTELTAISKHGHLNYMSSLSQGVVQFNPKDIAVHGLTAMIKVMAQMKDLRRGHTYQGLVKKVAIDQTYEGYANFMAAGRMQSIQHDAKSAETALNDFDAAAASGSGGKKTAEDEKADKAQRAFLQQRVEDARKVFDPDVLKPRADTYLTPQWDEMVPFPTSKSHAYTPTS